MKNEEIDPQETYAADTTDTTDTTDTADFADTVKEDIPDDGGTMFGTITLPSGQTMTGPEYVKYQRERRAGRSGGDAGEADQINKAETSAKKTAKFDAAAVTTDPPEEDLDRRLAEQIAEDTAAKTKAAKAMKDLHKDFAPTE